MKTKAQVLRERPDQKRLINAVISRLGMDYVEDVINHGVGGGFPGFTYYSDTTKFFKIHREDILKMAEEMASDLGEDILTMIQSFNCLGKNYSINEIGKAIYTNKGELVDQIQNAMAWFAAEEVCRMFEN